MINPQCRILTRTLLLLLASTLAVHGAEPSALSPASEPSGVSGPDYTGPSAGSDECDPEMVGFELITGYVYTAPTNMLESIPGTLMLTDCLETCQANDSCQAVNYETGLCVLFSSNADNNPGALSQSQFPVFTIYAQKSCLGVKPCERAWCIDRVQDHHLHGHARRTTTTSSRQHCLELCLGERDFLCRTATMEPSRPNKSGGAAMEPFPFEFNGTTMKPTYPTKFTKIVMVPGHPIESIGTTMGSHYPTESTKIAMEPSHPIEFIGTTMEPHYPTESTKIAMGPSHLIESIGTTMEPHYPTESTKITMEPSHPIEFIRTTMEPNYPTESTKIAMEPSHPIESI
ncbi:uncharacterized protein LOC105698989 [Orussus abietinus]|uniref:uncharacterized protein LOC105698989 n=1 Tax=Orussus abietinus TaxID=222816 RepID=UPI000C715EE2|nr:uncharacterized protein LOC105698989 [Orussus abietinus]